MNTAGTIPMGSAAPSPTLHRLRQTLAGIGSNSAPRLAGEDHPVGLGPPIDAVLGGGLARGALHELAPAAPVHLAAASGLALALAARASGFHLSPPCGERSTREARRVRGRICESERMETPPHPDPLPASGEREGTRHAIRKRFAPCGELLWIATDFAAAEAGGPYGPGLDRFGLAAGRFLVLRVPRTLDVLWAMEEALRCRALACVIAELSGDGAAADLTATRRLALAAREGMGLGLLMRQRATSSPSAAATRWEIAAALSRPDAFGGLGRTSFDLTLRKNRRGPLGRWLINWDHHERAFHAAVPVGVAETAVDRPDRTPLARAG